MNARRTIKLATFGLSLTVAAFGVTGCSGGGSNGSLNKFCADYVSMANSSQMQSLMADDNAGDISLADPAQNEALKEVAAGMQRLAKDAPSAIRGEAQFAAKVLSEEMSGNADADTDAGQTAGDHVDAYAQDHCPGATAAASGNTASNAQATDTFSNGADSTSIDSGSDTSSYGNDYGSSTDGSYSSDSSSGDYRPGYVTAACGYNPYGC